MNLWEEFETTVLDHLEVDDEITSRFVADVMGITWEEGSRHITRYVSAQRRPRSTTRYVLKRRERTSSAVWSIGVRTADLRERLGQFGDDIKCTVRRAVEPDLNAIVARNPRARRAMDDVIEPALEAFVTSLKVLITIAGWDPDDDGTDGTS